MRPLHQQAPFDKIVDLQVRYRVMRQVGEQGVLQCLGQAEVAVVSDIQEHQALANAAER